MSIFALHDPQDPRQQLRHAHTELLLERFAALGEADRTVIELVALAELPIRIDSLGALLRLTGLDPAWREHGVGDLVKLLLRLHEFLIDARAADLRAQGGLPLQRAAQLSLLHSGRAARIAEVLQGPQAGAVERLEPEYRSGVRLRLRIAGILAGMRPEALQLGAYRSAHSDPIGEALARVHAHLGTHDGALIDGMHPRFQIPVLESLLWRQLRRPEPGQQALLDRARQLLSGSLAGATMLLPPLADLSALRGETLPPLPPGEGLIGLAQCDQLLARLRRGEPAETLAADFDVALRAYRSEHGKRSLPPGMIGKLLLACLTLGQSAAVVKRREQLVRLREPPGELQGGVGVIFWQLFMGARQAGERYQGEHAIEAGRPDDAWWQALLLHWSGAPMSSALRERLQQVEQQAAACGWAWLAEQCAALLRPDEYPSERLRPALRDWLRPAAEWEIKLDALAEALSLGGAERSASSSGHSQLRIALRPPRGVVDFLVIEVLEQRAKGTGYTSGRAITTAAAVRAALERIAPGDSADRRLLQAMLGEPNYSLKHGLPVDSRIVGSLAGHPRVFLRDREAPISVVEGEIALLTERRADGRISLRLSPREALQGEAVARLQDDSLQLFRPDPGVLRIGEIIGEGIELPEDAAEQLRALLPGLARKLSLNADLSQLGVQDVHAEEQLIAQLEPWRGGLSLRMVVRPLGAGGGVFGPGRGPVAVLSHGAGQVRRARRDLAAERAALERLVVDCEALQALDDEACLQVEDPEAALQLLEALQLLGDALQLEWREGRPMRVARAQGDAALQLQVEAQRDWFAASGGLRLDDGSVVALAELLQALPSAQGRYLRLDEQRVVALGNELRRRLQVLSSFADARGEVKVGAVAAFALEAVLDEHSERHAAFIGQVERMRAAEALQPALPGGLQAELRDYQIDGYRFLMRLAAAGLGACLADDMGLGKTVQALAVLLARSSEGPALVVAPTSVIGNWRREAQRFAPRLALRVYGEGDRGQALSELGHADVVLVSYGLLASNADAFAALDIATLVLDEAQAIKNPSTQRAQAVRNLNAQFRLACTGTPLENHLGELWSLFRVLNPGLLGSEEQFRRRFLTPLERDPRGPERDVLRRLIAPFLLRRTKAEVLSELPPRTEIVLQIEPSAEEARLLAALRRQAIDKLRGEAAPVEQRRMHILAELTRLRRAACHPQLVAPELGLVSSKLEQLVELLTELVENHHRTLVFSQFTDYLAIVRQRLQHEGIGFQYLDGSTPQKARDAAVTAFQDGVGEVFLLSLKAGGVGLNLTAADYVIHLDPWWNPAVEQQASDRAHRIGQTRPVTVYKLVLAGSIEEQILDLHGSKRELVDQVIGETTGAAPVSAEDLLELLGGD
jgi:superfamily II DNA or RNA helicase